MATLDQLFNKGSFAEKRPSAPKWGKVGDYFDWVATGEPEIAQQLDVNQSWEPMWLEYDEDADKWVPTRESQLTRPKDSEEGLIKLTQILLPVTILGGSDESYVGKPATLYFDNPAKKAALEDAMTESGIDLGPGVGGRMERVKQTDKKRPNAFAWQVTLALPDSEDDE